MENDAELVQMQEGLLLASLRKRHYNEVLIMADRRKLLETLQDRKKS